MPNFSADNPDFANDNQRTSRRRVYSKENARAALDVLLQHGTVTTDQTYSTNSKARGHVNRMRTAIAELNHNHDGTIIGLEHIHGECPRTNNGSFGWRITLDL